MQNSSEFPPGGGCGPCAEYGIPLPDFYGDIDVNNVEAKQEVQEEEEGMPLIKVLIMKKELTETITEGLNEMIWQEVSKAMKNNINDVSIFDQIDWHDVGYNIKAAVDDVDWEQVGKTIQDNMEGVRWDQLGLSICCRTFDTDTTTAGAITSGGESDDDL